MKLFEQDEFEQAILAAAEQLLDRFRKLGVASRNGKNRTLRIRLDN